MPIIVLIGAGSSIFSKNVLGDCMLSKALEDSTYRLCDIDAEKLKLSKALLDKLNDKLGGKAKI